MPYTGNSGRVKLGAVNMPVTSWEASESITALDVTHQDETPPEARDFISDGLRTMTGSGVVDLTDTVRKLRPTKGAEVDIELVDQNTIYFGKALITSESQTTEVGEKVNATFEFQTVGIVEELTRPFDLFVDKTSDQGSNSFEIVLGWTLRTDAESFTGEIQQAFYRTQDENTGVWSDWLKFGIDIPPDENSTDDVLNIDGISNIQFYVVAVAVAETKTSPKSNIVNWRAGDII